MVVTKIKEMQNLAQALCCKSSSLFPVSPVSFNCARLIKQKCPNGKIKKFYGYTDTFTGCTN